MMHYITLVFIFILMIVHLWHKSEDDDLTKCPRGYGILMIGAWKVMFHKCPIGSLHIVVSRTLCVCRIQSICTAHRLVYLLVSQTSSPVVQQLIAQCAIGCWPSNGQACGRPVVVFVDSTATTWSAVQQLTEELAAARDIHRQCAEVSDNTLDTKASEALHTALTVVTSAEATHHWKQKCRDVFGVGFSVSLVKLAQMGASEARMHQQGKTSGISTDLMTLFSNRV